MPHRGDSSSFTVHYEEVDSVDDLYVYLIIYIYTLYS